MAGEQCSGWKRWVQMQTGTVGCRRDHGYDQLGAQPCCSKSSSHVLCRVCHPVHSCMVLPLHTLPPQLAPLGRQANPRLLSARNRVVAVLSVRMLIPQKCIQTVS